ncbi:hypothetical protein Y032_0023g832 [Ancylostoma ceylanicum]|nr:hypothetical protein Y032_0023g832 [Ancylostoma ceylanicum]
MSIEYFNEVLEIMQNYGPLRRTVLGVAKQAGCTAAGTAAGGLLMGPLGALVGGVMGAIYGYRCSDEYDSLILTLRSMTDTEKRRASAQIQRLVGSASIQDFLRYIATELHRKHLINLLLENISGKTMSQ